MPNSLIFKFQETGDPDTRRKLLDMHRDTITKHVKKWSGVLPEAVLEAHAETYATDAFRTFDPKFGTHINTHLYNHLSRLGRLNYDNQNIFKIPEHQIRMISSYNNAKAHLHDSLGREPEDSEVADHLGVPVSHVSRLSGNLRMELASDSEHESVHSQAGAFSQEALYLNDTVRRMSPEERQLFHNIQSGMKPGEIAKNMHLASYELSRLKAALAKRFSK